MKSLLEGRKRVAFVPFALFDRDGYTDLAIALHQRQRNAPPARVLCERAGEGELFVKTLRAHVHVKIGHELQHSMASTLKGGCNGGELARCAD